MIRQKMVVGQWARRIAFIALATLLRDQGCISFVAQRNDRAANLCDTTSRRYCEVGDKIDAGSLVSLLLSLFLFIYFFLQRIKENRRRRRRRKIRGPYYKECLNEEEGECNQQNHSEFYERHLYRNSSYAHPRSVFAFLCKITEHAHLLVHFRFVHNSGIYRCIQIYICMHVCIHVSM